MTWWMLARSAGYVALLTATLSIALGALGTSPGRIPGTPLPSLAQLDRRLLTQQLHRTAGVLTLAMLSLHAALLVADSFVSVGVVGALVPFTAGFRGFALGLGTLATYGFLVAAASGAMRGRLSSSASAARGWRGVHLISYAAWFLALCHGVLAGTDTGSWWSWMVYGTSALSVCAAAAYRLVVWTRHGSSTLQAARHGEQPGYLVSGGRR